MLHNNNMVELNPCIEFGHCSKVVIFQDIDHLGRDGTSCGFVNEGIGQHLKLEYTSDVLAEKTFCQPDCPMGVHVTYIAQFRMSAVRSYISNQSLSTFPLISTCDYDL